MLKNILQSTFNTRPLVIINYASQNIIYRSDKLDNISEEDIYFLIENGITDIIDLREIKEREIRLLNDKRFKYHLVPLQINSWGELTSVSSESLEQIYGNLPSEYMDYIQQYNVVNEIIDLLVEAKGKTVIMCSHGKDRTGVIIALILLLLGIDDNTIINDYVLSSRNFESRNHSLILKAKPEIMRCFIDMFKEKYVNKEEYLKDAKICKWSEFEDKIKHKYL